MRPTYAEINLGAINENLRQVRGRVGRRPIVMAVVKANAYGHGMITVARSVLKQKSAAYLGVAIVEEGIALRRNNISAPTLVFTVPSENQLRSFIEMNLDATICSLVTARKLDRLAAAAGRKAIVHVKVDTGMGRIGILPKDVLPFMTELKKLKNITVRGIYTHFATSDERHLGYARRQLSEFNASLNALDRAGIRVTLRHCANSGAILQMKDSYFDMVRPGIMMYGYRPSQETRRTLPLKPAMSIRSQIAFMKQVPKGTSISYGRRYVTGSKTNIGSVAIGYADGISRRLTNKANALVNGRQYPIVGTICMDQLMIDFGSRREYKVGDRVTLLGRDGKKEITGWDIAEALGTIPYEVCCAISERIPRTYIHG